MEAMFSTLQKSSSPFQEDVIVKAKNVKFLHTLMREICILHHFHQ